MRIERAKHRFSSAFLLGLASLIFSGCATPGSNGKIFSSKWAMDDDVYAQQYSAPYSKNTLRKWSRMGQQMVDARFEEGQCGVYVSGGVANRHQSAGVGEVGLFALPTSWSTVRIGALGLAASGLPNYLVGGVVGGRIHTPTRLAPYVGLSTMAAFTSQSDNSSGDGSSDTQVPSSTTQSAGMVAIVPEAGLSYWVNSRVRMNTGASYYVTSQGRDQDFLLVGVSLEFIPWDNNESNRPQTASPELEAILNSEAYRRAERESDPNSIWYGDKREPSEPTIQEPEPPAPPLPGIPLPSVNPPIAPENSSATEPLPANE